mmetsp:Transcript_1264/g.5612  ORF Transcript_1264/g.5612 Transcript_1264/m.5612 type:complete len:501 (+) Transcript_1264:2288-3790(+)
MLEHVLRGGVPHHAQVLLVQNPVGVQRALNLPSHLLLLHGPHLLELLAVVRLEGAELDLELLELLRHPSVVVRQTHVFIRELLVHRRERILSLHELLPRLGDFASLDLERPGVLVVPLHQYPVVVLELLRVEQVGGLHVRQVPLQVTDVALQPNLEQRKLLRVVSLVLLELRPVRVSDITRGLHELDLSVVPLLEQTLERLRVRLERRASLLQKHALNLVKLGDVRGGELVVPHVHAPQGLVNFLLLPANVPLVRLVLLVELLGHLGDERILARDDLVAQRLLRLNGDVELVRNLEFTQLVPFARHLAVPLRGFGALLFDAVSSLDPSRVSLAPSVRLPRDGDSLDVGHVVKALRLEPGERAFARLDLRLLRGGFGFGFGLDEARILRLALSLEPRGDACAPRGDAVVLVARFELTRDLRLVHHHHGRLGSRRLGLGFGRSLRVGGIGRLRLFDHGLLRGLFRSLFHRLGRGHFGRSALLRGSVALRRHDALGDLNSEGK